MIVYCLIADPVMRHSIIKVTLYSLLTLGIFSGFVNAGSLQEPASSLMPAQPEPSDPAEQFTLGKKYDKGDGVPQDKAQALTWYRKAAEQGYAQAQLLLGIIYDQGVGVAQDYAQALDWYRKAAEQGYAKAQYNLGAMYDEGLGQEQDYRLAADWYRKAAEQGYAKAQFNLGSMYFKAEGLPQNNELAYMWLHLASAHGLKHEVKKRIALVKTLTPAQIKKGKKMAREWQAEHNSEKPAR